MSSSNTRLMRAIGVELSERIIPELQSADAIERAGMARGVLQDMAADIDVLADIAQDLVPQFRSSIKQALQDLPSDIFAEQLAFWNDELARIAPETDMACQREVAALRQLAASIVRQATDAGGDLPEGEASSKIEVTIAALGALDYRLLTAFDAAKRKKNEEHSQTGSGAATGAKAAEINPESVTRYLRSRFPESAEIEATRVVPIPGGRSKLTYFIDIAGSDSLPAEVVMRQDYALRYEGTKVVDEYEPLLKLSRLQLPVPGPLLLEKEESALGPPFIFVERLSGTNPGTYFGLRDKCPGAFADLARTLAKIHQSDPCDLGLTVGPDPQQNLLRMIESYQKKWRDNATKPSPLVDYAYSWARRECLRDPGGVALVHGDGGPYNFLVQEDRLSALLDWEFVHVGDPAEDLGIARVYAEDVMSWDEFLNIYTAAGGPQVPERRVQLSMVLQFLKGTTLVATSGRNFEEGWTNEFIKGGNSFVGIRLIELRIAGLLNRFGAV